MPRYELVEGSSSKFWEIKTEGKKVIVRFGKIGATGQTQLKEHPTPAAAQADLEKQIAAKLKKGYQEVSSGGGGSEPAPKETAATRTSTPSSGKKAGTSKDASSKKVASSKQTEAAPATTGNPAAWHRLELEEGGSSKFWETRLEGKRLFTRFGKLGTSGQTRLKDFPSAEAALAQREQEIAGKLKEGYQDVQAAAARLAAGSNPELEAAILANLDDESTYLVYGDWLQSRGDPRGELITIQAGLRKNPGDKKLLRAQEQLLQQHAAHFFGKLAEAQDLLEEVEWQLGFIKKVKVRATSERDPDAGAEQPYLPIADVVGWLLDHPSGRFLQDLTVGIVTFADNTYTQVCNVIGKRPRPALRHLFLGDFTYEETELNWSSIGDARNLYQGLPNLRTLKLRSGSMSLGQIELPELLEFHTITGGLDCKAVKAICQATWPRLQTLSLQFGRGYEDACTKLKEIAPILDARGLPELKVLGITNCEFTDELCGALPGSKILPQLRGLDLSMGTMSDEGAALLVEHAAAFQHLSWLDVNDNYLSDGTERLLGKVCREVRFGEQREDEGPGERYASAIE